MPDRIKDIKSRYAAKVEEVFRRYGKEIKSVFGNDIEGFKNSVYEFIADAEDFLVKNGVSRLDAVKDFRLGIDVGRGGGFSVGGGFSYSVEYPA